MAEPCPLAALDGATPRPAGSHLIRKRTDREARVAGSLRSKGGGWSVKLPPAGRRTLREMPSRDVVSSLHQRIEVLKQLRCGRVSYHLLLVWQQ
jgi:hypothetical protein